MAKKQHDVKDIKLDGGTHVTVSNGDVATILEKTEGAIKSLQHRALGSLERALQGRAVN